MTRITRSLPVLTFMIAVAALVVALWPVWADAPWEDRMQDTGADGLISKNGPIGGGLGSKVSDLERKVWSLESSVGLAPNYGVRGALEDRVSSLESKMSSFGGG